MKPLVSITKSELDADPSARLWALVFYLAEHPSAQRDPRFQPFWLAYMYDAEVKNGGHLQYFHNQGVTSVQETLAALRTIGANGHAALLEDSWRKAEADPVFRVSSLAEYSELARDRSFESEDSAYYKLSQDVLSLLEAYYEPMLHEYISVSA
ncbi:MAG: DUF4375 domain-containing protein [Rhodocyclales bacterium]|nr:DUF4375 domain-containing protein [Rhodocyclales bacterium]